MDPRLLGYYEQELQYLRELGGEFAREFPKIAGNLGLSEFECADPYVERLLEGCALMAARVQLKMDAEFPRFTEHILNMVCPHFLCPTPSLAVVHLKPSVDRQATLNEGYLVNKGTTLRAEIGGGSRVTYNTSSDVTLWPLEVVGLRISQFMGDVGDIPRHSQRPFKSTLRIRIRTISDVPIGNLAIDELPLFVRGESGHANRLYELLVTGTAGISVIDMATERALACEKGATKPLGFSRSESLLPSSANSFSGYRLLQEYFALPTRFMFVGLSGLAPGLRRVSGNEAEIVILLDRHEPALEEGLEPGHLLPFCTPAINLFQRATDRIHLSYRDREYHVVPDRTRPLDYEVHSIRSVEGVGANHMDKREFRPLFACTDRTAHESAPAYYTVHREQRRPSAKVQRDGARSGYAGSEVFISLTDGREGPFQSDIKQLSISALCTNRDLPMALATGEGHTDFIVDGGAPMESVRCVAGPSRPRPALSWGERSWRLLNHLTLNYLSLTNATGGTGAEALRELLGLYAELSEPGIRRQVDGIASVSSQAIVRRVPLPGPVTFARGLRVELGCDDAAFEGGSTFLFGSVLDRFFAGYASMNSFVQTALSTKQREKVTEWPIRLGERTTL